MIASSSGWLPFFLPTWIMPGIWCVLPSRTRLAIGGVEDQNFQRGDTALFVDALEKVLRDDAFERFGKRGANFVLLFGRENVDDTVDRLGRAWRVQCAEDEVAGAGGDEREFDRFKIAHFADQNDVRIFAQRAAQRGGK